MRQLMDFEDMDGKEIFLKHVAPGLGCVVAFIMFFSPFKAVMQIRKTKQLGELNPLPLVAIIANCAGWLMYGCITQDIYIILANEPGLLLGVFMAMSCYGFADVKLRDTMLRMLLFFTVLISVVGVVIALALEDDDIKTQVAGYTAVTILMCYYGAPLSTMAEVYRSRSSASLYWPTSLMNTVNGSLWVAYGLAVHDGFIMYPNLVGAVFGLLQVVLIQVYPAKRPGQQAMPESKETV